MHKGLTLREYYLGYYLPNYLWYLWLLRHHSYQLVISFRGLRGVNLWGQTSLCHLKLLMSRLSAACVEHFVLYINYSILQLCNFIKPTLSSELLQPCQLCSAFPIANVRLLGKCCSHIFHSLSRTHHCRYFYIIFLFPEWPGHEAPTAATFCCRCELVHAAQFQLRDKIFMTSLFSFIIYFAHRCRCRCRFPGNPLQMMSNDIASGVYKLYVYWSHKLVVHMVQ